jgi:hypothetical protein
VHKLDEHSYLSLRPFEAHRLRSRITLSPVRAEARRHSPRSVRANTRSPESTTTTLGVPVFSSAPAASPRRGMALVTPGHRLSPWARPRPATSVGRRPRGQAKVNSSSEAFGTLDPSHMHAHFCGIRGGQSSRTRCWSINADSGQRALSHRHGTHFFLVGLGGFQAGSPLVVFTTCDIFDTVPHSI